MRQIHLVIMSTWIMSLLLGWNNDRVRRKFQCSFSCWMSTKSTIHNHLDFSLFFPILPSIHPSLEPHQVQVIAFSPPKTFQCQPHSLHIPSSTAKPFLQSHLYAFHKHFHHPVHVDDDAVRAATPRNNDPMNDDQHTNPNIATGMNACQKVGLSALGITGTMTVYHNLDYQQIWKREVFENNEGVIAKTDYGDAFCVATGKYTGRAPKDRFIVYNPGSETAQNIDWNDINQPTTPQVFQELFEKAVQHYNQAMSTAYVFDGYCGANLASRKKVRFIHEKAWQHHFVTNMFIRPEHPQELVDFDPDFTFISCSSQVVKDWERLGLHSETAVVLDIERKLGVVFGTWYGGENKKGIFSLMNYWLPMQGHMSMHCSANVGKDGDVALFFGLSGTGKTTLSTDPHRALIGDDEHGWDDESIFNLEGGCYAKTINLSEDTEPDIYRAITTNALLENIKLLSDGKPDYKDTSITENGRVSYPIYHIPNYHKPQIAGHPKNIIFLSCDAYGVLPPVARLTVEQAMYHFMSGYTAKVAGTEHGIKEPVATFSTCFGAAFMPLHATHYADLLRQKLEKHGSRVYLVNSGWSGGPYGKGQRMSIKTTRKCIDSILDGSIEHADFETDPLFGFEVPKALPGVDTALLDARSTWSDKAAYDATAMKLAKMYANNFKKYEGKGSVDYTRGGPKIE